MTVSGLMNEFRCRGGEEGESGTSRPSSPLDLLLTSSLLIVGELNYVMIVCDYLRGSERSACNLAKSALSLQTNTSHLPIQSFIMKNINTRYYILWCLATNNGKDTYYFSHVKISTAKGGSQSGCTVFRIPR